MTSGKAQLALQMHAPRPRGRPKAEALGELEARLISVARQAFIAHGYGATSMAAVARDARVSKNTLYARFPSKAHLFRAIMDEQIGRTDLAARKDIRQRDKSLEATLRSYAEHMTRASLSGDILQLNRLIYSEAGRFPELGEAASARMRLGAQQVADYLRDAAERDGVPCREPEKAAAIFIMMLRGWYGDVLLTNRTVSGPELRGAVEDIVRLFLASRAAW